MTPLLLLASADPLDQVDRLQSSFQKDALTATAAIFCVAFFTLLMLFMRAVSKHAVEVAALNAENDKQIAALHEAHSVTISQLHVADRERAVKLEITLHSLLEMIEDFRVISYDARRRLGKPPPAKRKVGELTPAEGIPATPRRPQVEPDDFLEGTLHIDPQSPNPLAAKAKK